MREKGVCGHFYMSNKHGFVHSLLNRDIKMNKTRFHREANNPVSEVE